VHLLQEPAPGRYRFHAHDGLAHARYLLGEDAAARQHWQQALAILTSLGSEGTEDPDVSTTSIRAHLRRLEEPAGGADEVHGLNR
jgi:hypothetical protein